MCAARWRRDWDNLKKCANVVKPRGLYKAQKRNTVGFLGF